MEVPEPSTVSFIGSFFGLTVVSLDMEKNVSAHLPDDLRICRLAESNIEILCGRLTPE